MLCDFLVDHRFVKSQVLASCIKPALSECDMRLKTIYFLSSLPSLTHLLQIEDHCGLCAVQVLMLRLVRSAVQVI